MHKSRLGNIVIDVQGTDLWEHAVFWSAALGCPLPGKPEKAEKFIQLQTRPGEVQVILQAVEHPPRVHLDIETDDIVKEVARLQQAGATVFAEREKWVVMQAPSGHRFCVGRPFRAGFDAGASAWRD